jgi:hypothetical protein
VSIYDLQYAKYDISRVLSPSTRGIKCFIKYSVCDVCATCVRRVSDETTKTSHTHWWHTAYNSYSMASNPSVFLE